MTKKKEVTIPRWAAEVLATFNERTLREQNDAQQAVREVLEK